jgi:hypothetical protein
MPSPKNFLFFEEMFWKVSLIILPRKLFSLTYECISLIDSFFNGFNENLTHDQNK